MQAKVETLTWQGKTATKILGFHYNHQIEVPRDHSIRINSKKIKIREKILSIPHQIRKHLTKGLRNVINSRHRKRLMRTSRVLCQVNQVQAL